MIADSLSGSTYHYPRCVRHSGLGGDLAAAERQGKGIALLASDDFPLTLWGVVAAGSGEPCSKPGGPRRAMHTSDRGYLLLNRSCL